MRPLPLAAAIAAAASLASCTPDNPHSRIQENPARYGTLSDNDRSLVESGRIRTGMTQDAVFLAWGKPDRVTKGGSGGDATERWTYTELTPVWTHSADIGFGSGFGRYGSCRYGGYYDYGPSVTYIPYTAGVVHFTNGRVSKWEEAGR